MRDLNPSRSGTRTRRFVEVDLNNLVLIELFGLNVEEHENKVLIIQDLSRFEPLTLTVPNPLGKVF